MYSGAGNCGGTQILTVKTSQGCASIDTDNDWIDLGVDDVDTVKTQILECNPDPDSAFMNGYSIITQIIALLVIVRSLIYS